MYYEYESDKLVVYSPKSSCLPMPKKFKYKNNTGLFEVSVFLNDHYKIRYCGKIETEKISFTGYMKLDISKDGAVTIWVSKQFKEPARKFSTGFRIDNNKQLEINKYIEMLKYVSDYMKINFLKKDIFQIKNDLK